MVRALGRVVAVVVLVGLCGGVPAVSVWAQVERPGRVGRLSDVTVMRGAMVDVEVAGGFSGVVDS